MGYRNEPQTTEEHLAYVYELLRRLRFHNHPIVPFDHTHPPDCPCPVNVRHCTVSDAYDADFFVEGPFEARYDFADFSDYDSWIMSNDPIAYYRMDETSGTTLNDSSGNAHHLSTFGTPTLNQTGPLSGMKAISWDGVDDRAREPSGLVVDSVVNYMVVGWLKTPSAGGSDSAQQCLVTTRDGADGITVGYGPGWGAFGGGVSGDGSILFADDGTNLLGGRFTQEDVSDDAWHIFHAIWTGQPAGHFCGNPPDPECFDTWSVYVDGVLQTMTDINEGVNTGFHNPPLTGGALNVAYWPSHTAYWSGLLAGLAFFTGETTVPEQASCELLPQDDVLLVDGTGGTLPIPAAGESPLHHQWVKNIGTGQLVLNPPGLETIDDQLTLTLVPMDSAHLFSDGVEWWVL